MHLKILLAIASTLFASGCASTSEAPSVTIRFADQASLGGMAGSFREIDRKPVSKNPEMIMVTPGEHEIGYACPNTILMDGPLRQTGQFQPSATYLLRCSRDGLATLEKQ